MQFLSFLPVKTELKEEAVTMIKVETMSAQPTKEGEKNMSPFVKHTVNMYTHTDGTKI